MGEKSTMTTTFAILWTLLSVAGLAALFYAGWRHQTTAEQKDDYMAKWLSLIGSIAPYVLLAIPGIPPVIIPAVVHGIQVAEGIQGASGAQKKAAVLDLVSTALTTVNGVTPGSVDVEDALSAVSGGIDTTISVINTVHNASNQVASNSAPSVTVSPIVPPPAV